MNRKKLLLIILVIVIMIGTCRPAFADDDAYLTPDSRFYFLKNWGEWLELKLTHGSKDKLECSLKIAQTKLTEVDKMIKKGKPDQAVKALDNYQRYLDKAEAFMDKSADKGDDMGEVIAIFERATKKNIDKLESTIDESPDKVKGQLNTTLKNTQSQYDQQLDKFKSILKKGKRDSKS